MVSINHRPPFFLLIVVILLSTATTSKSCHPIDEEALLQYKSEITDDPSNLLQSWNSTTDCCSAWVGITCDSTTGRVVNVSMPCLRDPGYPFDTSINCSISPFLGNLSSLQILHLSNCKHLTGTIPSELGKLANLRVLFLNDNNLTGTIPASFQHLSNLQKLNLRHNAISGPLHSAISHLPASLAQLILTGNQFIGPIPTSIGKLGSLVRLDLDLNQLSGPIPSEIGYLKNVNWINLWSNRLNGSIPTSIGKLSNLNFLALSWNMLSGSIPASVMRLNFWIFDVAHNQLSGPIPVHKSNLPTSAFEGNLGLCDSPLPPCK